MSKKKLGLFFVMQNFTFLRGWVRFLVPFLSICCHFFMQNFSFLRGWEVFLSKKRQFFHAKIQFLRGWTIFLSKKTTIIWDFLENVGWAIRKIEGSLVKLKRNYILYMYLSILKEAFIIWGIRVLMS